MKGFTGDPVHPPSPCRVESQEWTTSLPGPTVHCLDFGVPTVRSAVSLLSEVSFRTVFPRLIVFLVPLCRTSTVPVGSRSVCLSGRRHVLRYSFLSRETVLLLVRPRPIPTPPWARRVTRTCVLSRPEALHRRYIVLVADE